jgi:hypothetical protein
MNITELFTTYWSQLTLILLGIGYFIKRVFDNISNKREINHNLFQQNRIDSLNRFFKAYSKTEQMWTSIAIWDILDHKLSAKELDNIVFPLLNELKASVMELQIYFKDKDHKHFEDIVQNIILIKGKLGEVYFDFNPDRNIITNSNNFQYFRDDKLKENEKILKNISQMIQKTFK